jgi:hypothetical protein
MFDGAFDGVDRELVVGYTFFDSKQLKYAPAGRWESHRRNRVGVRSRVCV